MAVGGKSVDDHTMMKAADDKSGCRQRSTRHNILRRPAPLLCLDDTFVAVVAIVVNDDDSDDGGAPPSMLPEAAAAVDDVVVVVIRILDGCRPRRGGRTTRLPGSGGGS